MAWQSDPLETCKWIVRVCINNWKHCVCCKKEYCNIGIVIFSIIHHNLWKYHPCQYFVLLDLQLKYEGIDIRLLAILKTILCISRKSLLLSTDPILKSVVLGLGSEQKIERISTRPPPGNLWMRTRNQFGTIRGETLLLDVVRLDKTLRVALQQILT